MTRRRYRHDFILDRPVAAAFPLFTPKGEEAWVPGWNPVYFAPKSGETEQDMVFATGEGAEKTWWTCLDWRPEEHRVRYLRLTPDSRCAFVTVACEAHGTASTAVSVDYDIQSLGPAGDAYIATMTDEAFAETIGAWPEMIARNATA